MEKLKKYTQESEKLYQNKRTEGNEEDFMQKNSGSHTKESYADKIASIQKDETSKLSFENSKFKENQISIIRRNNWKNWSS